MKILLPNDPHYERLFEPITETRLDEMLSRAVPLIPTFRRLMDRLQPRAVGLCAPQVGIFDRWFMTHLDGRRRFYAQPAWSPMSDSTLEWGDENCFSAPGYQARVQRHSKITVIYFTEDGIKNTVWLNGYAARVFLHEYDHLEGKTIFPKDWHNPRLTAAVQRMQATPKALVADDPS